MSTAPEDFRNAFYEKYVSTFKDYISADNQANMTSDYEVYKRRYLPLVRQFRKDSAILEIGCGPGYFMQFLKNYSYENIYGFDISQQQIERAKIKKLNAEIGDIFSFAENNTKKYKIIFALDFVEHFGKNEITRLFDSIFDLLDTGGMLIIHTPNGQGIYPGKIIFGDLTHLTIFNPDSLLQVLKKTGFNEIKFYETGPVAKNLKGFIRLILWKMVRKIYQSIIIAETGSCENILTRDFICTAVKSEKG
jgi:2-polyprenyl-3-methyl-5-hydroxy-6-metoxy-1,4-benzoquinol methylase